MTSESLLNSCVMLMPGFLFTFKLFCCPVEIRAPEAMHARLMSEGGHNKGCTEDKEIYLSLQWCGERRKQV